MVLQGELSRWSATAANGGCGYRYILTNRHVVGPGPFWGYCVFDNHEEVDAYPVYRDPVHDFGILRFDPKAIRYMPITALPLRPDLAKGMIVGEAAFVLAGPEGDDVLT